MLAMVSFSERTRKWGPIGIQYLASSPIGGEKTWTVPVQADFLKPTSDFKGAAKKPDGTVTCIANRSLITETGQVFAKDILGSNPVWPNDSQFLFWHNQAVWMCDGNSPKQLFPLAPSYFCYAKDSPARTSGRSTLFQDKQFFVSLGDFCFESSDLSTNVDTYEYLLGLLKENPDITWLKKEHMAVFNRTTIHKRWLIMRADRNNPAGLEQLNNVSWCVTDKTKLEDISDLSAFQFQRSPGLFQFLADKRPVVLLKRGNSYLGMIVLYTEYEIIPVGKYHCFGGLSDEKGKYILLSAPTSDHAVFICDWKYWSQTPK
ncbi:hypothetical protein KKG36_02715 [Patescibacteria group bacterium]|nr:hypothetical protein [Patescibacteria group bacterium]